jgi:hypothetical protein
MRSCVTLARLRGWEGVDLDGCCHVRLHTAIVPIVDYALIAMAAIVYDCLLQ